MNRDVEDVTDLVRADGKVRPQRPTFDFMKPRLSRWIALGLGSGLSSAAPGTVGTLLGWALYRLLQAAGGDVAVGIALGAGLVIGLWAIERTGRDLGASDHGSIVWDEILAIWLVLLLVPASFTAQLVAVLLFRAFDILKPPPIRAIERRWKNAWGVIADDLMAAAYTVLVVAFWQRAFG